MLDSILARFWEVQVYKIFKLSEKYISAFWSLEDH